MVRCDEKSNCSKNHRRRMIRNLYGRTFSVEIVGVQVLTLNLTRTFWKTAPLTQLLQVFEKYRKMTASILVRVIGIEEVRMLLGYSPVNYKLRQHVTLAIHHI